MKRNEISYSVSKFYFDAILLILLVLLFVQVPLSKLHPVLSYLDEVIILSFLCLLTFSAVSNKTARSFLISYGVISIILFLFSIHSIGHRGLLNVAMQIFIHLKYFILFGFIWVFVGVKRAKKLLLIFLLITIFFMIFNILTGPLLNKMLDASVQYRFGFIRPVGIQADTASLAMFLSFGAFYALSNCNLNNKEKIIAMVVFAFLILLSSSRTALIVFPLLLLWRMKGSIKSFSIILLFFISFTFTFTFSKNKYIEEFITITTQNIEWTTENPVESGYIRGIMIFFSFEVANEYFPLGSGAATYGTVMSEESNIYADLGLHNSRFFIDTDGIYDSNFASLLGEFGYIGIVLYLFLLYRYSLIPLKINNKNYSISGESKFVMPALIFLYAITVPIFMNTFPAFMLSLLMVSIYNEDELPG